VSDPSCEWRAAVGPGHRQDMPSVVSPGRDTRITSVHVVLVEPTHLPPEGRADAAAAGAA
jgi:hypothetical protein